MAAPATNTGTRSPVPTSGFRLPMRANTRKVTPTKAKLHAMLTRRKLPVLSGSGSVREHVQRLGRILRPAVEKRAILYELVAADTAEEFTSERRRRHTAYGHSGD